MTSERSKIVRSKEVYLADTGGEYDDSDGCQLPFCPRMRHDRRHTIVEINRERMIHPVLIEEVCHGRICIADRHDSNSARVRKLQALAMFRFLTAVAMLILMACLMPADVFAHNVTECQGNMGTRCSQSEAYAALLPMPAAHCNAHTPGATPRSVKIVHYRTGERYDAEFGCNSPDGRNIANEQSHYTRYNSICQEDNSTFGCGKDVAELVAAAKTDSDPSNLFHNQQTCIAMKSCELRCKMDNCRWMDKVIPGFTRPYLDGDGLWPQIETSCDSVRIALLGLPTGKWIADRQCFSTMGWYHVLVDLKNSLSQHGCGSQHDWDLVGQQIVPCLKETQPGYPQPYYRLGGYFVNSARERVRATCHTERSLRGQPLDINANISGKVCEVGL